LLALAIILIVPKNATPAVKTTAAPTIHKIVKHKKKHHVKKHVKKNAALLHLRQYNKAQLEALWIYEGGNPHYARMAASIALAESTGRPNAYSYSHDRGLWQINEVHGYWSSFNVAINTKAAIMISNNGRDWYPWVTYQTGAYLRYY